MDDSKKACLKLMDKSIKIFNEYKLSPFEAYELLLMFTSATFFKISENTSWVKDGDISVNRVSAFLESLEDAISQRINLEKEALRNA